MRDRVCASAFSVPFLSKATTSTCAAVTGDSGSEQSKYSLVTIAASKNMLRTIEPRKDPKELWQLQCKCTEWLSKRLMSCSHCVCKIARHRKGCKGRQTGNEPQCITLCLMIRNGTQVVAIPGEQGVEEALLWMGVSPSAEQRIEKS